MLFSQNKSITLRPKKEKRLSTFLLALITASVFFVPYMLLSEGYFIFYGDFNVQQIPFYQTCHQAVREGNIFWSSATDLGANFIGSYSFYLLGSPFFWLTIPFPNFLVPYLMGPLLILKFACAALTGYLFIRRFTRTPDAAQLGGLLYAFSGFSVYNIFFNHFHEAIIIFPLLLLSLELLLTENRRGFFAVMVALSAVSNYFFFFGMVVFCIIYFFVRLFTGAVKVRFSRFLIVLLEAVLGVLIAAFLLLPSLAAIVSNSRVGELQLYGGWNAIMYGKEQIYLNIIECFFFPPDLPARPIFFPGAEVKWSSLGGWLPLFGMTGVFVWFTNKKSSWQKRILGICLFMALVPVLNSAFYAFNQSYYARWFYMPILIMCLVTASAAEDTSVNWNSGWRWSFGITVGFAAVIGLFPQKDTEAMSNSADPDKIKLMFGLYTRGSDNTFMYRFFATVMIALIAALVVRLLMILMMNGERITFIRRSTALVCVFAALYANVFVASGRSHSYDIKEVMIDTLIEGEVELEKGEEYRVDVYDGVDNTGMYLGLNSINAFHSIVPSSVMEFYRYVGEKRDVASRPEISNYALRSLLAVKYLLNRSGAESFIDEDGKTKMPDFKYTKTSGGYYIYENENFVPYGVSYDYYMTKEFCDSYNEDLRAALMLKAVILSDEQIKLYGHTMQNIEDVAEETYFDTDYEYTFEDEFNDEDEADEDILNSAPEFNELYNPVSLYFDSETLSHDCDRLKKTAADEFSENKGTFTAKVNRAKSSLVYFQIPYDEGWSATVNGEKAVVERVNVGFMAVLVPAGESTIVLSYKTPLLEEGILITAAALIILAVYLAVSAVTVRKMRDKTVYPEGEELLRMWRSQDIAEAQIEAYIQPRSILDDTPISIPEINQGFEGGFKIDMTLLQENENADGFKTGDKNKPENGNNDPQIPNN